MDNSVHILHSWIVRRLQAGGSAALVTGAAMAVQVSILLAGFSMNWIVSTDSLKSTLAFVCTLISALAIVNFHAIRELKATVAQIKKLIKFDGLTGILSRKYFLDYVMDSGKSGYILIVDADYFKRINDSYGHGAGDAALIELAHSIGWGAGNLSHVGRLGGEEFGVFFPGVSRKVAQKLAEDIRAQVARRPIYIEGIEILLTVSIGAAPYNRGEPLRASLTSADENLFRAKALGRNMVVFDDEQTLQKSPYEGLRVIR